MVDPLDLKDDEILLSSPAMWKKGRKKGMLNVINPWACRSIYLLRSGKLRYYDGIKLRGELILLGGECVKCEPEQTDGRSNSFEVCNSSIPGFVSLFLMAKDEEERTLWIKSINLLASGNWDKEKEREEIEAARMMPYPLYGITSPMRKLHKDGMERNRKVWKDNLPVDIRSCVGALEMHSYIFEENKNNQESTPKTNPSAAKQSKVAGGLNLFDTSSTGMNLTNIFSFGSKSSNNTTVSTVSTDGLTSNSTKSTRRTSASSATSKQGDLRSGSPDSSSGASLDTIFISPPFVSSPAMSTSPAHKGTTSSALHLLQYNRSMRRDINATGTDWRNEGRNSRGGGKKLSIGPAREMVLKKASHSRVFSEDFPEVLSQTAPDNENNISELSKCRCGRSEVMLACETGALSDLDRMEEILREAEDHSENELRSIIDEEDSFGMRPAHLAVSHGHVAYLELLMRYKVDLRPRFFKKLRSGSQDSLRTNSVDSSITNATNLTSDTSLSPQPPHSAFPSEYVMMSGSESLLHASIAIVNDKMLACLELLLASSAICDINHPCMPSMWTPLHKAAFYGNENAVAAILRYAPPYEISEDNDLSRTYLQVMAKDCHNRTALQLAAAGGHIECVKLLLHFHDHEEIFEYSRNEDLAELHGGWTAWTTYQLACANGHSELLKFLLENLTDYMNKKHKGDSWKYDDMLDYWDPFYNVAHFAAVGGNAECLQLCNKFSALYRDFSDTRSQSSKNINETTVMHVAASHGNTEAVTYLLTTTGKSESNEENCDNFREIHRITVEEMLSSVKSKFRRTPMLEACSTKNDGGIGVLDVLFRAGASIGAEDEEGNNALHIAARRNNIKTVRVLVGRYGLEGTHNRNRHNQTALEVAMLNGNNEIERILIRNKDFYGRKNNDEIPELDFTERQSFMVE